MGMMSKEQLQAHLAKIQAEYKIGAAEARREYRRKWMSRKRQRDRDAREPSRVVLDVPPDLAALLVSRKPAGLSWPEYLSALIQAAARDVR
jgi:hypothetical protein